MTPKHRALLAAATLFGFAAIVLSLKLIGGPATSGPQSVHSSTVTPPTTPIPVFPVESPPAGVFKPPLVLLPDMFGATCGSGINLPGKQGWPTRAGRGTPETACAFAVNVLEAYRDSHPSPGSATRTVTADSVVQCPDYGEQCDGPPVVVNCAIDDNNTWVTCSDRGEAQVLLF
jgi:serine/threonine-protein kinase